MLTFFAAQMVRQMIEKDLVPDLILGTPWAGVKFSQEVARILGCRHIFAEKKGDSNMILGRYENEIRSGERVAVGEELVNNAGSTNKIIDLIESGGGDALCIICAINRSFPFRDRFPTASRGSIPIMGVIERSTPQYRQDDPMVAEAIASGNIIWKPKYSWGLLKGVMDANSCRL